MTNSRKRRGRDTERLIADYWRRHGWTHVEAVGAGSPGTDLTGTPGCAVEIKARTGLNLGAWMKQARRNAGHMLPVLILRLNGQGEAALDEFPVVLRHDDFMVLLKDAGYLP